jgi:hypothetical protein
METLWLPASLIALAIVLVIFGPTRLLNIGARIAHGGSALLAWLQRHAHASGSYSKTKRHDSSTQH